MLVDRLRCPVVVAPMSAGPSTPELVIAAASAGAVGFLAAGYKTPAAMTAEIEAVRAGGAEVFGVNLFVPGAPAADRGAVTGYLASLGSEAAESGVAPGEPAWDDDGWEPKIAALLAAPPPVLSFTFGCPSAEIIAAFRAAGSLVWVTVTSPAEAMAAAQAGADSLCVQGPEAGAHRGTFTNADQPADEPGLAVLIGATRRVTRLPMIAAGGICARPAVTAALAVGASAVQCGTAFLRCPESGAHPAHKAALADSRFSQTAVTRAFTGRPARGLVNRFMLDHPAAPAAYPEIHNATRPLRAAAAAAGDVERMSLWAGQGYREATARPAAEIVAALCGPPAQLR
jgi:nitronate monooxygenase